MKNSKVSIIIVNWNGMEHLKKCYPSLEKIDYPNFEIILVDNASVDDSVTFTQEFRTKMSKRKVKVKIVTNKKNLGFSGGNNVGLPFATGKYILLLNNDTIVKKDFITHLVKMLDSDKKIGGIQSKILSMDYPDRLDSVGAFYTRTGFLFHYGYFQKDKKKYDKVIDLYTAKGACMMFRKDVIDRVGLFDEDFFAYFEETDFCHRVWLLGYSIKYEPKSIILHKVGGTSNAMNNAFIQYHSFKNRINSYLKNLGFKELVIMLPFHLLLCEMAAVTFILRGKPQLFVAINRAFIWNLRNIRQTFRKRKYVQEKIRTVSDRDLFGNLRKSPPVRYYYYLFAKSLVGYRE